MESFSETETGCDYQSLEHFMGSSPWSHREVVDKVALELDELLGGGEDSALYVDESCFPKKGKSSVGVARQYCGRTGKIDNCQMGVFAALGRGKRVAISDFRLYLPKQWCESSSKLKAAGVPQDCRSYAKKHDLAMDMVVRSKAAGLRYRWIGFDAAYGADQRFCNELEDRGERYVGDIISTQKVWTVEPTYSFPKARMGRPRKKPLLDKCCEGKWVSVRDLIAQNFESESLSVVYRDGAKGVL